MPFQICEEVSLTRRRPIKRFGYVNHVDYNCLDSISFALDLQEVKILISQCLPQKKQSLIMKEKSLSLTTKVKINITLAIRRGIL